MLLASNLRFVHYLNFSCYFRHFSTALLFFLASSPYFNLWVPFFIEISLARSIAAHLNWNYCSTDKLARHPGRPWQSKLSDIPKHVVEHYQLLSADELIEDVVDHYRKNVWQSIENIVTSDLSDSLSKNVVIEGSALLPELVSNLNFENISSVWLIARNEFLRERICTSSQYATKTIFEQMLIDKFWKRNCLLNDRIIDSVERLGLVKLHVEAASTPDELMNQCLQIL